MHNIRLLLVLIICAAPGVLSVASDEVDAEVSSEEEGSGDGDFDDGDDTSGESGESEDWDKYGEEMQAMQRASWKLNHGKPSPKAGKKNILIYFWE